MLQNVANCTYFLMVYHHLSAVLQPEEVSFRYLRKEMTIFDVDVLFFESTRNLISFLYLNLYIRISAPAICFSNIVLQKKPIRQKSIVYSVQY